MKALILFFLILIPIQWETDFEQAKKTAKEKNELILLNFSGSDWCGPCIMFRKDYLESDSFQAIIQGNLIMVNADFPRKKKNQQSDKIIRRNEALAEVYNKEGIFPYTLLLNSDGKVLKSWKGKPDMSVEQWTKEIKTVCNKYK